MPSCVFETEMYWQRAAKRNEVCFLSVPLPLKAGMTEYMRSQTKLESTMFARRRLLKCVRSFLVVQYWQVAPTTQQLASINPLWRAAELSIVSRWMMRKGQCCAPPNTFFFYSRLKLPPQTLWWPASSFRFCFFVVFFSCCCCLVSMDVSD